MPTCRGCEDPAVRSFIVGAKGEGKFHLCYFHAADDGLLALPLETIQKIQKIEARTAYAFNGIAFVFEAVCRAEKLESADDVSIAVIRSARQNFPRDAKRALANWNITHRNDIGKIVFELAHNQLVRPVGKISTGDFEREFSLGDMLEIS